MGKYSNRKNTQAFAVCEPPACFASQKPHSREIRRANWIPLSASRPYFCAGWLFLSSRRMAMT
jgi:hypothetical protein